MPVVIAPPIPLDESQRLQTLRDLNLLDTPAEERFDRVTRLAKQLFSTSIALVSIVDEDRQWFKSRQGLDATETPRDISFCGHAILDDKIMVVNNAEEDERFCDNPLVCDNPNIRFYAGYPLAAPDGSRIGTLCVIDDKPKELSTEQLQLLRELGRMVEEELIAANESAHDSITGLSNRNGLIMIADHLLPVCCREKKPATLLMFHAQNLHQVEMKNGGVEADAMAVELAHMLMANFRNSDIVARVSFDVFVVLLSCAGLDSVEPARYRFDEQLSARNREPSNLNEIEIDAFAIAYKKGRHDDAAELLKDGESRIVNTFTTSMNLEQHA